MDKPKIAIHKNDAIFNHSTNWNNVWIDYCQKNNLNYGVVNCFDHDILATLRNYTCLVWHFSNYALQEMLFARSILNSAKKMGIRVFPDYDTAWHFDDKIAEYYYLQAVDAPVPKSYIFYDVKSCTSWLKLQNTYPLIAKLRCGSGSNNVKMIRNYSDALKHTKRMFGRGYKNVPSIFFKTKSNLKSAGNCKTILKRAKRIPDFIQTYTHARMLPGERGYTYFQEFIPNDGYDIKIVVVGDKLSFIARNVRKGDFRASGGGTLFFDRNLVTPDIINTAFETSDKLGFQCMGYDYVVDNRTNKPYIIEISYGFSHTALMQAGGYWDRNGLWHNEPLNAPAEVLMNLNR